MRYDDRLRTILRQSEAKGAGALAQWRQLVDILAQRPDGLHPEDAELSLRRARALQEQIPEDERAAGIAALAGRLRSVPLVRFLCDDSPMVCIAAVGAARLSDEEWADLIPRLSTRARGILRARDDLGQRARAALAAFARADFALPAATRVAHEEQDEVEPTAPAPSAAREEDGEVEPPAPAPSAAREEDGEVEPPAEEPSEALPEAPAESPEPSPISELVERIERYRDGRGDPASPDLPLEGGAASYRHVPLGSFRFESDHDGQIVWTDAMPRGALVGTGIAQLADGDGPGTDGYGAAAFRQRMPISNARIRLAGSPVVAGDWRFSAVPFFDSASGRFRGYRGQFRRPNVGDDPALEHSPPAAGENLQELIHELRTPLNAVIGFGEIIEQQFFGPVAKPYRALASDILDDARRLLTGFDDLGMAARLSAGRFDPGEGETGADWLFERLDERLRSLTETHRVTLDLNKTETASAFAVEPETAERTVSRLLAALIVNCAPGESLEAVLNSDTGGQPVNMLDISRPERLSGKSERELLDADQEGEHRTAPLLGLGFSLRLVRSLAGSVGGRLDLGGEKIRLTLPAAVHSQAERQGETGE